MNIDELNGIVNQHNNTHHRTIKMRPLDVKPGTYIDFNKENIRKVLNLKMVIMLEYQNIKMFLRKVTFQIRLCDYEN